MTITETDAAAVECLTAAGLAGDDARDWLREEPDRTTDFSADRTRYSGYWLTSARLLGQLPQKARRSDREQAAARLIQDSARDARVRFLRGHAEAVYDALTVRRSRFVRVEDLVTLAAGVVPGLVPTAQEIAAEEGCLQRDKGGLEIDHGLFLSAVLASERAGRHLCHAMLLPRPEAEALLPKFERDGMVELDGASVNRLGKAAVVTQSNPRFLNAEDQTSLAGAEIWQMKCEIGVNDTHQRDVGKMQTFRDHLRAHQDVDLARAKTSQRIAVSFLPRHRIGIHAAHHCFGK